VNRRGAVELAARKERTAAIRLCRRCDPCGWQLDTDGTPIDPAVRCAHNAPRAPLTPVPDAAPDLFSEPRHQPEANQ
jgi:hypothetical protein